MQPNAPEPTLDDLDMCDVATLAERVVRGLPIADEHFEYVKLEFCRAMELREKTYRSRALEHAGKWLSEQTRALNLEKRKVIALESIAASMSKGREG